MLAPISVFLIAISEISQVQAPQAEKDFELVFQEAGRGQLVEAENLFDAAIEKYFIPGQTPPKEAVMGVFWQGSALFAGLLRGHRYRDLERVINHMLPIMEAAEIGDRGNFLYLYLDMLADSYRAEADYKNAAKAYERARSLNVNVACGHYQYFIGVTEVYLAQERLSDVGSWLQLVLERTLAACEGVPSDTQRRAALQTWFDNALLPSLEDRILPITWAIADRATSARRNRSPHGRRSDCSHCFGT